MSPWLQASQLLLRIRHAPSSTTDNAEEQTTADAEIVRTGTTAPRSMVCVFLVSEANPSADSHVDGYSICHLTYTVATAVATVYKGDALWCDLYDIFSYRIWKLENAHRDVASTRRILNGFAHSSEAILKFCKATACLVYKMFKDSLFWILKHLFESLSSGIKLRSKRTHFFLPIDPNSPRRTIVLPSHVTISCTALWYEWAAVNNL
jgi:hypothetical protein